MSQCVDMHCSGHGDGDGGESGRNVGDGNVDEDDCCGGVGERWDHDGHGDGKGDGNDDVEGEGMDEGQDDGDVDVVVDGDGDGNEYGDAVGDGDGDGNGDGEDNSDGAFRLRQLDYTKFPTAVTSNHERAFVGCGNGSILVLNNKTFELLWIRPSPYVNIFQHCIVEMAMHPHQSHTLVVAFQNGAIDLIDTSKRPMKAFKSARSLNAGIITGLQFDKVVSSHRRHLIPIAIPNNASPISITLSSLISPPPSLLVPSSLSLPNPFRVSGCS